MQAYIQIRGTIFAQSGYCLNAYELCPEGRLQRKMCAYFSTLDANGKTVKLEKVPGTVGDDDPTINIVLRRYVHPEKAHRMLVAMCACLEGALAGDTHAKEILADAWRLLVVQGCALEHQPGQVQIDMLGNLFGKARVAEHLNKYNTVAELVDCDPIEMVNEGLNLQ